MCLACHHVLRYARLARRGALRKPTVTSPHQSPPNTGHSMAKRPRLNASSAPTMQHDNHVNDTETHCELMQLRFELARCPLSSTEYKNERRTTDPVTTPFALRVSSATHLRHRPRGNSLHDCIQKIIGHTIPYSSPPTLYYIEDVTVNLDQYTICQAGHMILLNVTSSLETLLMCASSFTIAYPT